jgi:hypothetical protein
MREHGGGMERCPVGIFCSAPFSPGFLRGWPFIGCRKRRPVHPSGGMFPSIFWCFWFCGPSVSISFFGPSQRERGDLRNSPCRSATGSGCAAPFRWSRPCCCFLSCSITRRCSPHWERDFSGHGRRCAGSGKGEPVWNRGLSAAGEGRGDRVDPPPSV